MQKPGRLLALLGFLTAAFFLCDRLIKAAVLRADLAAGPVIPGLLQIVRTENTGYAFSLFSGGGAFVPLLSAAAFIALVAAEWIYRPYWEKSPVLLVALSAVNGGALGNLWDRAAYGAVTDYIRLLFIRFPVFNFADICVTAGLLTVAAWVLLQEAPGRGPAEEDT